jgi:hypothetical protein
LQRAITHPTAFPESVLSEAGFPPGWIARHSADYDRRVGCIVISGGSIQHDETTTVVNTDVFRLDLKSGVWTIA